MAMNVPPEENQPQQPVQPEQAPAPTPAPEQAPPVDNVEAPPAEPAQEEQVIEEVAQGLADEEITAEDIMVAVLSDSLGLSPNGARSLFQLLMQDLVDETAETEAPTEQPPME